MFTRKRVLVVATAAVLSAIALFVAQAGATGSSHSASLTLHSFTISSSTKSDAPGTRQTAVGLITGQPVGQAVSNLRDKVTSASSSGITFVGTFTIYTVHGELQGMSDIKITPQPNGGATGSGTLKLTGGTGRYRGAHGKLPFTGQQSPKAPDFTAHIKGNISY